MDARDKRFLCGVLRQGVPFGPPPPPLGEFPYHRTPWRLVAACRWTHRGGGGRVDVLHRDP